MKLQHAIRPFHFFDPVSCRNHDFHQASAWRPIFLVYGSLLSCGAIFQLVRADIKLRIGRVLPHMHGIGGVDNDCVVEDDPDPP